MTTSTAAGLDLKGRKWIHVIDTDVAERPGETQGAKLLRERRAANCAALDQIRASRGSTEKIGTGGDLATIGRFAKDARSFEMTKLDAIGLFPIDLPLDWQAGTIPLGGLMAMSDADSGLLAYGEPSPYPLWVGSTNGHGIVKVDEPEKLETAIQMVVETSTSSEEDAAAVMRKLARPFKGEIRDRRIDGEIVIQPVATIAWQGSAEIVQGVRLMRRLKNSLAAHYQAPAEVWALSAAVAARELWKGSDLDAVLAEINDRHLEATGCELAVLKESESRPAIYRGDFSRATKPYVREGLINRTRVWMRGLYRRQ